MNAARRARPPRLDPGAEIRVRLATSRDDAALADLAQLSGREHSPGPWVVAEVDGTLRAAVPLGGGEPLADPFRPTAELCELLTTRAKQLRADDRGAVRVRRRRLLETTFRLQPD
jgi:hypothetical protein